MTPARDIDWPLWEVFVRPDGGLSHQHVGSVHAPDATMALRSARDVYTRRNEGVSIWVVPGAAVVVADGEPAGGEPVDTEPADTAPAEG
jgi:ring-1,2-phenylacetyl-CoA epoxidase subunit PaaB